MIGLMLLGLAALSRMRLGRIERWEHALAGGIIAASGLAILVLGI